MCTETDHLLTKRGQNPVFMDASNFGEKENHINGVHA